MIIENLFLAAHTKDENTKGFIFNLQLSAIKNHSESYTADGKMAETLLPLLKKVAHILKEIQLSWTILNDYELKLTGDYPNYDVKQYDSAGLGLAIGLYNIARKINKSSFSEGIIGTGMIRLDGSVSDVRGISSKQSASLNIPNFKKLLGKNEISHLLQLHSVLTQYN